jgi:hypothetical protein
MEELLDQINSAQKFLNGSYRADATTNIDYLNVRKSKKNENFN